MLDERELQVKTNIVADNVGKHNSCVYTLVGQLGVKVTDWGG